MKVSVLIDAINHMPANGAGPELAPAQAGLSEHSPRT